MRLFNNFLILNPTHLNLNRKRKARHTITRTNMRLHVYRRVLGVFSGVEGDKLDGPEETPRITRSEELFGVGAHTRSTKGFGHLERDGGV